MKRFLLILCILALLLTGCARSAREISFHVETGVVGSLLTVFSGADDALITLSCGQNALRIHAPQASFRLQPHKSYSVSIRADGFFRAYWTMVPMP